VTSLVFVHTADCHLDSPFKGIGREESAVAERLRNAQRGVFDDLVNLCIEREAAFLVIAGDLFDAEERSLTTRVRLREAFRKLGSAGIRVFIATGNHDSLGETRERTEWPENVHLFSAGRPETVVWPEERPRVALTGISYARRAVEENLAATFPPPREGLFNIAVLHCNVDGDPAHDNYAPCRLDELLRSGYDYWALGHIHAGRVLAETPALVVYPGCIQGRHIAETGEKGAVVVSVDLRDGKAQVERVGLERIRWLREEVVLSGEESREDLLERLRERSAALVASVEPRIEGLIVRWRLAGRLGFDRPDLEGVLDSLREMAFESDPFVWPEALDAAGVVEPFDLSELAGEESPRGDLVRLVERLRADRAEMDRLRELLLEKVGPPQLGREIEEPACLEEILEEALSLGLELLAGPRGR